MDEKGAFEFYGIDKMKEELTEFGRRFYQNLDKVLTQLAEKIIQDARRLAPIDSGDLEAALDIGEVKAILSNLYIDFGVTVSPEVAPYAWAQHEGYQVVDDVVYAFSPGPKTRSKGMHKGYAPGKKYLQNAITINEVLVLEKIAEAMTFGGGM